MAVKTITISAENLQLADGSNGVTVVAAANYLEDSDASNSVTYTANKLTYTLSSDGSCYIVTGAAEGLTKISIPSYYNGLPVRAINESAFYENTDITSVIINSSVRNIGAHAFEGCINLSELTFKDREPIIYFKSNANWQNATIEAVVPVHGNYTLVKTLIGSDVNGNSIHRVTVPLNAAGVQFANGSQTTVNISFSDIECFGCYECYLDSTGSYSVRLCEPDCNAVEADIDTYDFAIGNNAFAYCDSLTAVNIPNSVRDLGAMSFMDNMALAEVTFSETSGIKTIGTMAFQNCYALTEITFPDSLVKIGSYAFNECKKLAVVTAGKGLKEIGTSAFEYCLELTTFRTQANSAGLEKIGAKAFYVCSELTDIGEAGCLLPRTVWYIGNQAFSGCDKLTKINFAGTSTATASGWFYTSGEVSDDRTSNGDYNAISANFIMDQASVATALTDTYSMYKWFKIQKMPAPTISLSGHTLTITDKTGIAQTFKVYADGEHWATINTSNNSITIV